MSEETSIKRIEELESRIAFQEDMLTALNTRVAEQNQELAKLQLQLKHLNGKIKEGRESGSEAYVDERPPHY